MNQALPVVAAATLLFMAGAPARPETSSAEQRFRELPDFGHIHGLNEYVSVKSLLECRDFLYRLVKIYAEQK
jgi:acetylornithine deacetylase/succinyl-diaminopimelate desuccinylase-like protein